MIDILIYLKIKYLLLKRNPIGRESRLDGIKAINQFSTYPEMSLIKYEGQLKTEKLSEKLIAIFKQSNYFKSMNSTVFKVSLYIVDSFK